MVGGVEEVVEVVKPYLSKEAIAALEQHGPYLLDEEGDFSTTTIDNKECAFAYYDEQKILKCGIEQAWKDGKTDFQKLNFHKIAFMLFDASAIAGAVTRDKCMRRCS